MVHVTFYFFFLLLLFLLLLFLLLLFLLLLFLLLLFLDHIERLVGDARGRVARGEDLPKRHHVVVGRLGSGRKTTYVFKKYQKRNKNSF